MEIFILAAVAAAILIEWRLHLWHERHHREQIKRINRLFDDAMR